ncbi:MAG TPA: glycosyltransferase family 39 protein, partial [Polyangia bacterium]
MIAWAGRVGRALSGWRPGVYLFISVVCLYGASMSRETAWGDARPIYSVADSMLRGDGVAVNVRWPSDAPPGRNGKFYAAQPWLPSLVHVPGAAIHGGLWYLHLRPELEHLSVVFACHLAGALLGGLVAWLFFRLCRRHGARPGVAGFAAILLATGTMVWVYARYPFSEITQIACFTGFFLALSRLLERLDWRTALGAGLWAGLLFNTKYIYALSLGGALLIVLLEHRKALLPLAKAL